MATVFGNKYFDQGVAFDKRFESLRSDLSGMSRYLFRDRMIDMLRWMLLNDVLGIPMKEISDAFAWPYDGPEMIFNPDKFDMLQNAHPLPGPVPNTISQKDVIEFIARFSTLGLLDVERVIGTQTMHLALAGETPEHVKQLIVTRESLHEYRSEAGKVTALHSPEQIRYTPKGFYLDLREQCVPEYKVKEAEAFQNIYLMAIGVA